MHPVFSAIVLVVILVLLVVLIIVLVIVLVLVVILITVLVSVLVIHFYFLRDDSLRLSRYISLYIFSGFILCFEKYAC